MNEASNLKELVEEPSKGIRAAFERRFSVEDADAIMAAAEGHKNGIHDKMGSDPFRWALCICIGFQCLDKFKEHHGIKAAEDEIKAWIKKEARLDLHDGDVDYVSLFCGTYNEYMPEKEPR